MKNEILLIPEKNDSERDSVAKIWEQLGGKVIRLGRFWVKPKLENGARVSIYGNDTFSLVLAQVINVELLMPNDELIAQLDFEWTKRKLKIINIEEVKNLDFPRFLKPVKPKIFKSGVYNSYDEFLGEFDGIEKSELIISSEVIKVEKEIRSFILENEVKDLAYYEGEGSINEAKGFINKFLNEKTIKLPSTYVLDLGFNKKDGWFIIEFNSSWGAGLNFCRPEKVIECIRKATKN